LVAERQILKDDVLVPATGQGDRSEEPYDHFEHGSIPL